MKMKNQDRKSKRYEDLPLPPKKAGVASPGGRREPEMTV